MKNIKLKNPAILFLTCMTIAACMPLTPAMKAKMTPEEIENYQMRREVFLKSGGWTYGAGS
ncbi:MAG: hypothetical protein JJ939_04940 [Alphaproteobacteria bacterium]|jgi:hypothetical protein|nr:hypothetical protein [Rhodobiaceae bacterium]MBO6544135.1 hypothetical protein [Alphaproteobacteria bacterium]MBO6627751.1 hypothetical protein [Alphaproteobacteria bacterium]MDF1627533.1 hypothetical protein [Parvibaculaceae bacterium]|tara:strand:+ start:785 stop:967 length:183 start_codon:yes stop_codon:yes gene_type:complete